MRYLRPLSLTWWAGVLALGTGVGMLVMPGGGQLAEMSRLVALLAGSADASPGGLIALGLGLIGLRDAVERGFRGDG